MKYIIQKVSESFIVPADPMFGLMHNTLSQRVYYIILRGGCHRYETKENVIIRDGQEYKKMMLDGKVLTFDSIESAEEYINLLNQVSLNTEDVKLIEI